MADIAIDAVFNEGAQRQYTEAESTIAPLSEAETEWLLSEIVRRVGPY